jgi:hypothetical protein
VPAWKNCTDTFRACFEKITSRAAAEPIALVWERCLDGRLLRGLQLSISTVDAESGDRGVVLVPMAG